MKIKFGETVYTVLGHNVNVMPSHFQVNIDKGDSTIDDIIANVVGVEEIIVYDDDDNVAGVYRGYTKLNAITTYDGQNVSVELLNTDMESQIDSLMAAMNQIREGQNAQGVRLAEVAAVASDLTESQETQDHAIEDLGEVVSELIPEEE